MAAFNTPSVSQSGGDDPASRLQKLASRREDLQRRHARLQVVKEQAESELVRLREEMVRLGTTPETIESDLHEAERDLLEAVERAEKLESEFTAKLLRAEQNLERGGA